MYAQYLWFIFQMQDFTTAEGWEKVVGMIMDMPPAVETNDDGEARVKVSIEVAGTVRDICVDLIKAFLKNSIGRLVTSPIDLGLSYTHRGPKSKGIN